MMTVPQRERAKAPTHVSADARPRVNQAAATSHVSQVIQHALALRGFGTPTPSAPWPAEAGRSQPYGPRRRRRDLRIIETAVEVSDTAARDADAIGFQAWVFTQVSLPHKAPKLGETWTRRNGRACLVMQPGLGQLRRGEELRLVHLPSGATPRLLLSWLVSRMVSDSEHSPEIELPDRQALFLRELYPGVLDFSGRRYARFRTEFVELAAARIYVAGDCRSSNWTVTSEQALWWDDKRPDQPVMFPSWVRLSDEFCRHILEAPVPFDRRTLASLASSTVAMDLYLWLTWRLPKLEAATLVRWEALVEQFSSGYARLRDFRARFEPALRQVLHAYATAKVEATAEGLILRPSPPHIPSKAVVVDMTVKVARINPS